MKVFWFDCETSGLDPEQHGIITLAYVVEIDGSVKESGELYADPQKAGKVLDPKALQVNGLTPEQISDYPHPEEMYQQLDGVLGRYVDRYASHDKFAGAGYNVEFDMRFLRKLWLECGDSYFGSWFAFGVIDPAQIVRFLQYTGHIPHFAKMNLATLAKRLGVDSGNAHDAGADIAMTMAITNQIKSMLEVRDE